MSTELLEVDDTEIIIVSETEIELIEVAAQGPPGNDGAPGSAAETYQAGAAVSGHMGVAINSDGEVEYASCDSGLSSLSFIGVTTSAASSGADVPVRSSGEIEHGGWTWTPGLPVFLGLNGALTQTLPPGALFCLVVGYAHAATRLLVNPQPPISLS